MGCDDFVVVVEEGWDDDEFLNKGVIDEVEDEL